LKSLTEFNHFPAFRRWRVFLLRRLESDRRLAALTGRTARYTKIERAGHASADREKEWVAMAARNARVLTANWRSIAAEFGTTTAAVMTQAFHNRRRPLSIAWPRPRAMR
jgi:hypothetical protein